MKTPSPPHLVLIAGGRTFYYENPEKEPGAQIGQVLFLFAGAVSIWFRGLYQPIHLANGVFAACVLVASVALDERARHVIWGRRFGIGIHECRAQRRTRDRRQRARCRLRGLPRAHRHVPAEAQSISAW